MTDPASTNSSTSSGSESDNPLPPGHELHEFRIERVLGEGGFGVVYLARDLQLHRTVALKEYMPATLAARQPSKSVIVRSERNRETFDLGLRSFVNEARLLASFDHPSLVKVYRFWEQHGTAYMVMPYYEGPTLKAWVRAQPALPSEAWLKDLLRPLLDALELIHSDRCFHRDIAPDNILLTGPLQRPVLLDFGAARRVITDATQALTTILKPGYAPIEQYAEMPSMKQGAWTDVYALCAVLYSVIVRRPPIASVARIVKDELTPISEVARGQYSDQFLATIDAGLSVRPEQRPQTIAELRTRLLETAGSIVRPTPPEEEEDADKTVILSRHAEPSGAYAPTYIKTYVNTELATQVSPRTALHAPPDLPVRTEPSTLRPEPLKPLASAVSPSRDVGARRNRWVLAAIALGSIGAAAASIAWWVGRSASPAATPTVVPPVAVAAPASGVVPAAMPPASAPGAIAPAPAPIAPTPSTVLDEIVRQADGGLALQASAQPARVTIQKDKLLFKVRSDQPGYVYAFMTGADGAHLWLLFPNTIDKDNRIVPGKEMSLPRPKWSITADGPAGNDHIVLMLSSTVRDFDDKAFAPGEPIREYALDRIAPIASRQALTQVIGTAHCRSGARCEDRYGATSLDIEEVAAAP